MSKNNFQKSFESYKINPSQNKMKQSSFHEISTSFHLFNFIVSKLNFLFFNDFKFFQNFINFKKNLIFL